MRDLIEATEQEMQADGRYKGKNGYLPLLLGSGWARGTYIVFGGPFAKFNPKEEAAYGICLRETKDARADVWLPIDDFSVPKDDAAVNRALKQVVLAILMGHNVYAGCMGGWGRTGLFLAILAKATGQADPVGYVRALYTSHAVETDEQKAYVSDFDVTEIQLFTKRAAWVIWALKKLRVW